MSDDNLEFMDWIESVQHDIGSAVILFEKTHYYDMVIYHIHQGVEKLFKAFLVKQGVPYRKVHNLEGLLADCLQKNKQMSLLKDSVIRINVYQNKLRYPEGDKLTLDDANSCFEHLEKIVNFMNKTLQINIGIKPDEERQ